MNKRAFIIGASGQDGSYLTKYLVERNYKILCSSRGQSQSSFLNHQILNIHGDVEYVSLDPSSFDCLSRVVTKFKPNEIYNLSGQSSVGYSFTNPIETIDSIYLVTKNILEFMRIHNASDIKFYSASSSECFGDQGTNKIHENTSFSPLSPYAAGKVAASTLVSAYREAYGLFACSGYLFNHESPLRRRHFVTKKIIQSAIDIKNGTKQNLAVGNIKISRDWGWAEDYIVAMHLMLNIPNKPKDYIIGSGESSMLEVFIEKVFNELGLDYSEYIQSDSKLLSIKSNEWKKEEESKRTLRAVNREIKNRYKEDIN